MAAIKLLLQDMRPPMFMYLRTNFKQPQVMNGDSLIIPSRPMQNKSLSISVNNRPLTKIPWIGDLSFDTILKIVHVDPNNIKDVELVRPFEFRGNTENTSI